MKKIFALMLVLALLVFGLTACKKAEQKAEETTAAVEEKVEEAADAAEAAVEEATENVEEAAQN